MVNGQVYDCRYSTNWDDIYTWMHKESPGPTGTIQAEQFGKTFVICEVHWLDGSFDRNIAIKNLARTGVRTDEYVPFNTRVMKIADLKIDTQVLEAFDYGLPVTNSSAPQK